MIPNLILELAYQDIFLYGSILIIYILAVYIFTRKYIYSIFDPLFYEFTLSIFGGALVIYMYFNEIIDLKYFSHYMLTQIAFIIGFIILRPLKLNFSKNNIQDFKVNKLGIYKINVLFYVSSIVHLFYKYLIY